MTIYESLIDLGFPISEVERMMKTVGLPLPKVDPHRDPDIPYIKGPSILQIDMITRESLRILENYQINSNRLYDFDKQLSAIERLRGGHND